MAEPSTVKLPELPTPHRFWPYAPVDGDVFHREQIQAYATSAVLEAIKRCATIADEWSKPDVLRLAAGEMTTQEMRTAQAVARGIGAAIRKDGHG